MHYFFLTLILILFGISLAILFYCLFFLSTQTFEDFTSLGIALRNFEIELGNELLPIFKVAVEGLIKFVKLFE